MPIHDWTRAPAGLFHDFQQSWSVRIKDALNAGCLSKGIAVLVEQRAGPREGDLLAIEQRFRRRGSSSDGGVAVMDRPVTRIIRRTAPESYADRANRIVIRHHLSGSSRSSRLSCRGTRTAGPPSAILWKRSLTFFVKGFTC